MLVATLLNRCSLARLLSPIRAYARFDTFEIFGNGFQLPFLLLSRARVLSEFSA